VVAQLRVERAREDIARVESQLALGLSGQAGVGRDLSQFGALTDRTDASLGLDKRLSFGPRVGVSAGYTRDDSDYGTTPALPFPNPSESTRADVSWRQPLARGFGNPEYHEGRAIAEAGVAASAAERIASFDQLARRAADLYFGAAFTHARLRNAEDAIVRAGRLLDYVRRNQQLGIAERQDLLQAEAQLAARRAEREALWLAWTQSRTALNRLLEQPWDAELELVLPVTVAPPAPEALQSQVEQHSPELVQLDARLRQAEAVIERNRDGARDQFDAVLSAGSRRYSGDTATGTVSTSEPVGSLRLEYRGTLGTSAADAELNQAFLDRSIALRQLEAARIDLRYTVSGLSAELKAAQAADAEARARVAAEQAKMDEATRRYRTGRTNTSELIQFENDGRLAELLADQQLIELARRQTEADILRGVYWNELGQTPSPGGQP
jgi:outer membrane protein TolC